MFTFVTSYLNLFRVVRVQEHSTSCQLLSVHTTREVLESLDFFFFILISETEVTTYRGQGRSGDRAN